MGRSRPSPVLRLRRTGADPRAVLGLGGVGLLGAAAALLVAAAWIPLRGAHPSVDVALALVVVAPAVGISGRRPAVIGAATGGAIGFTYFDTEPFDHFAITRAPDVETAVLLVVVGLLTGELAVRVARQRRRDGREGGDLGRVREAADRLARGQELVIMIGAVASQIARLLALGDCAYSTEEDDAGLAYVDRTGVIRAPGPVPAGADLALPVWSQGQVVGRFVLRPAPASSLTREHLLVAVTLADQVGAALAAQAPPVPPIDDPPPSGLRVVR